MAAERIAVIGTGVTGLAAAAGFACRGYPVMLCGEVPPPFDPAQDIDSRVFALNDASCGLLQSIGVWDAIAAQRGCYYEQMEVWSGSGRLRFNSTDIASTHLGVIVENRLLRSILFERLRGDRNVSIRCPAKFRFMRLVSGGSATCLTLDDGYQAEVALVVGADGADSKVRAHAGISYRRDTYGQYAIVATVECGLEHHNACLQRFSSRGVTAFLPLPDDRGRRGSIVWSCDEAIADELEALPDAAFGASLAKTLEYRLAEMKPVSKRTIFPLYGALVDGYIGEKVALVGDAAHSVHPLAGQGANMGLADVRDLLDVVTNGRCSAPGMNINRAILRRYERSVKGRNVAMKYSLDAIHRFFAQRWPLAGAAQSIGLSLVDRCLPMKSWFMKKAMGEPGQTRRH